MHILRIHINHTKCGDILDYRYWKEPESDFLMHYGVLGMHWGVRKAKKEINKGGESRYNITKKALASMYGEGSKKYETKLKEFDEGYFWKTLGKQLAAEQELKDNMHAKGKKASAVYERHLEQNKKQLGSKTEYNPEYIKNKTTRHLKYLGIGAASIGGLAAAAFIPGAQFAILAGPAAGIAANATKHKNPRPIEKLYTGTKPYNKYTLKDLEKMLADY